MNLKAVHDTRKPVNASQRAAEKSQADLAERGGSASFSAADLISGRLLARNALLNLIGQVIPLLLSVAATPFLVHGLGVDRFGLLSFAWIFLAYFSVFDLGLGRATTKFVAEALGSAKLDHVPSLFWTTVMVQALLGVLGTAALVGFAAVLVDRALNIPAQLRAEARATFYVLAFFAPVVLVSGSFSGLLQAGQRFDLVNGVGVVVNVSLYFLALLGVAMRFSLPGILGMILVARCGGLLALLVLSLRVFPNIRKISGDFALVRRLLSYGSWITVTNAVAPVLEYLDRFLVSSILSLAAVTYYTVPYYAITRLSVIPVSLTATLFPAFSALGGGRNREKTGTLFAQSVKCILLALSPVVAALILFGEELLRMWLGDDFAARSSTALQLLSLGLLLNATCGATSHVLLQAAGRPEIIAKFHTFELPIYAGVVFLMIKKWGIGGAAAAWALRVTMEGIWLWLWVVRIYGFSLGFFTASGLVRAATCSVVLLVFGYGLKKVTAGFPFPIQLALFCVLAVVFAWVAWKLCIEHKRKGTGGR